VVERVRLGRSGSGKGGAGAAPAATAARSLTFRKIFRLLVMKCSKEVAAPDGPLLLFDGSRRPLRCESVIHYVLSAGNSRIRSRPQR
jgi:hypothetical protein